MRAAKAAVLERKKEVAAALSVSGCLGWALLLTSLTTAVVGGGRRNCLTPRQHKTPKVRAGAVSWGKLSTWCLTNKVNGKSGR